jgi:hydrogenase maturation protease
MKTLILCLGDERLADDGIGAEIGRALQSLSLPADIQVRMVPRLSLELLDDLAGADHLVIVDALVDGAEPGTCTVVDVTQHGAGVVATGCCHASNVRDLIDLAREVAPGGIECAITIAGVEWGQRDRCGAEFSSAVLAAVPRLLDLLLLVTGAGLKIRLLAADTFRQNRHTHAVTSASYDWGDFSEQAPSFQ